MTDKWRGIRRGIFVPVFRREGALADPGFRCARGRGGRQGHGQAPPAVLKWGEVIVLDLNWQGVLVGAASLLIIGAFHPLVIWCEYHFTQRVWPAFLLAGVMCLVLALFVPGLWSILLGLVGVGCLWSIRELKQQARRVEKGWFPQNPKRKQK